MEGTAAAVRACQRQQGGSDGGSVEGTCSRLSFVIRHMTHGPGSSLLMRRSVIPPLSRRWRRRRYGGRGSADVVISDPLLL